MNGSNKNNKVEPNLNGNPYNFDPDLRVVLVALLIVWFIVWQIAN